MTRSIRLAVMATSALALAGCADMFAEETAVAPDQATLAAEGARQMALENRQLIQQLHGQVQQQQAMAEEIRRERVVTERGFREQLRK